MRYRAILPLLLLIASAASALSMEWTLVGDPATPCDLMRSSCHGGVWYCYNIATYEVTNAQYAEFLNAKAVDDPLGLYNANMGNPSLSSTGHGGIARSGDPGTYTYTPIAGRENLPVNWV